jgi:NAD+ synthase
MSIDQKLKIDSSHVETKITTYIRSILKQRDIEGLVLLFKDYVESLINVHFACSAVGKENVKLIVTEGRFSSRKPTKEKDQSIIERYLDFPQENLVFINIADLLRDINKIFLDKTDHAIGLVSSDTYPLLNYNLSYILLKSMDSTDFELKTYTPPSERPKTKREKFIQRSIAHYKSQIRLNMLLSFLLAESENRSFIGHVNKTEWLLGLFTKYGTHHAADILPLAALYRTQIIQLAEHLGFKKFLDERVDEVPTSYKFFFNLNYEEVDRVLIRLETGRFSVEEISDDTGIGMKAVNKIAYHYEASKYARSVPLIPKLEPE